VLNFETGGVVILQVGFNLLDQFSFVRTVRVQPKNRRRAGVAGTGDGQFDPVANRRILDLAGTPDVAGFDVLRQQDFAGGEIGDVGDAVFRNLESLVI